MAQASTLCLGVLLGLGLPRAWGATDACYDPRGRPQRCLPVFENAAFGREVEVTNTCGSPPEDYCLQMGGPGDTQLCHRCDAQDPDRHHNATYLTDFHSQEESTWWQSQSMAFGVQHPNSVNITLRLGKAYEITYVRLKFHTSRPESFAIYKRSRAGGPWVPYQYYSASCLKTYGQQERQYLRPGEDERVAFCTPEFSDISPLSGGNVAFSTLEGRPSAYNFDESPVLQEWVTSTELLISLDRLNTFGDDIFKDPKVLQSYYYAISDFSVGGRCKCHGHASQCGLDEDGRLVCLCQHNTTGVDCERCQPFYQDRPWARGTADAANECLPCNCSGLSEECFYDRELFRSTGHGGHCRNCRAHTAGPHCERCRENFYRWDQQKPCQPCDCHPAGSLLLQCDSSGTCICKPSVTGWKCDRCLTGFHSLSEGGCRPCTCNPAGSLGPCDPHNGRCPCKENVEGHLCDRCQPGTFNLQPHNPSGCTSCFCYGHSMVCSTASRYEEHFIRSDFRQGPEGWTAEDPRGRELLVRGDRSGIFLKPDPQVPWDFVAPEKFLGNQHLSYGQPLSLTFQVPSGTALPPVRLWLEGAGLVLSVSHSGPMGSQDPVHSEERRMVFRLWEAEETEPSLSPFHFQRLLSNLTALRIRVGGGSTHLTGRVSLREVQLGSARPGSSTPALWVESCVCPQGYAGQFCESCSPGYKREIPSGGPSTSCIPCTCNQHGSCDPESGICQCQHHTEGPSCERCIAGFYGNPFRGHPDDCKPCPCPSPSMCVALPESGEVVCTHCPQNQRGRRCELCDDGFFGDPLGRSGPPTPCRPCQCNGNVDPNAVGNCEPLSGRCLRCLHNTSGPHCEQCREGFYGNALAPAPGGNCTACSCNQVGSARDQGECDRVSGQCSCLPHVTGRDCSSCSPGFYDLKAEKGCKSCECHPVGSQKKQCHPVTGQCPCLPGITGAACSQCQPGFFGFSAKGCRACNCSPLGSITSQCHENGTCACKPGFVGYKCERCQVNFFPSTDGTQCLECPLCFSLVKDEADKLKAKLKRLERSLQKPECGNPWQHYLVQGDSPRGDSYHNPYLLQGARDAFLEQMTELAASVKAAWSQLQAARRNTSCARGSVEKTCTLLADTGAELQSAEREIRQAAGLLATMVVPQEVLNRPTNWSLLAAESRALAESHGDMAAKIETAARRAVIASNASFTLVRSLLEGAAGLGALRDLQNRYQEVRRAQKEVGTALADVAIQAKSTLTVVQRVSADGTRGLSELSAYGALAPEPPAEDLARRSQELGQTLASREHLVTEATQDLLASSREDLQKIRPIVQLREEAEAALTQANSAVMGGQATVTNAKTLLADLEGMKKTFPQAKNQAALRRKAGVVQDRLLSDAQKKTKQAERMLENAASVSTVAKKRVKEAELVAKESAKRAQALRRDSKQTQRRSGKLAGQIQKTFREISHQASGAKEQSRKLEEAEWVGTGLSELEKNVREARSSLEMDVKALSDLLGRLRKLRTSTAPVVSLNETRRQLERVKQRLAEPGPLAGKLSLLQREAEEQQLQIQDLERDIEEIRADRRNLEDILRSLPEGCASWQ
ncbi:laminin subunit gamma-3 [Tachyglossus aculeatus]|uniref:laminin subunit gamma-3 n=1 Tax=Tachyglossus aculeatus TaxID=9261 RepID=UPI0018F4D5C3|nr:laminin subunit gamma-3 [Tachyglossus aculeatus]